MNEQTHFASFPIGFFVVHIQNVQRNKENKNTRTIRNTEALVLIC